VSDLRTRLRPVDPDGAAERPRRLAGRRTAILAAAGAVVLALVLVWVIVFSPVFGVRSVQVKGARSVSVARIRAAADVAHGTPLVRLDTAAVTRRVERIPQIASAQVSTSFPSTVTITVVERSPVGWIRSGSPAVLVDADGVQYRTVAEAPAGLPRFVVPAGADARKTAAALGRVADALTPPLRKVVTSIQALDPSSITLTVTSSAGAVVVRWGSAAGSATKARVLPALLARHPGLVDLTDPDRPYTRP